MTTQRAPLSVKNAEINTAAVKINTLQISGKQVTLAVFRQLPEEYPIDRNGWKGLPWGWVNYLCERGERNVVWQQGAELKRGIMKLPAQRPVYYPDAGREWYWAAVNEGKISENSFIHGQGSYLDFPLHDRAQRFRVYPERKIATKESSASLYGKIVESADFEDRCARAEWERWKELAVLPQLFIAV